MLRQGASKFSAAGRVPLLPVTLPEPRSIGPPEDDELLPSAPPQSQMPRPSSSGKEGVQCKSLLISLGAFAFVISLVLVGVMAWRFFGIQDDLSKLNTRLITAEALLVNHTTRLGSLNTTLIATTARSILNSMNIILINDTVNIHEARITSLESRTTDLEFRLTADEVKLLGVMNNVTQLQADMAQAQEDIITIMAEIVILQTNASEHAVRISALEAANVQNILNIQNLMTWLQSNLTYIDARLGVLNTTYVVTASGTARLESGPAMPVPVTWQTRRVKATGGFDVEYLWISDSGFTPIQVFLGPSNSTYSFRVANFASSTPVHALPAISTPLARPLSAYQRSKFGVINSTPFVGQVVSSKWNNEDLTLEFAATMVIFDGVMILEPLTFVIGFL